MGTVNYVFPSAEHTRFSHSLGVFHMMEKILYNLKTQGKVHIDDADAELLEIAALLHDIGHYPCSHAIEEVYMRHMDQTPKGNVIGDVEVKKNAMVEFDGHHEKLGRHIIITKYKDMIDDHFEGRIKDAALEIGNTVIGASTIAIYNQLMHSDLDADRLDYLIRDSEFMGSRYGIFDIDQLLRNIKIDESSDGKAVVIDKRGLNALESYMLSRYFSRSLLISNKTISGFEILLQTAFELLQEEHKDDGSYSYSYNNILKTSTEPQFIDFNDHYLFNKIFEASRHKEDTHLKKICEMLVKREPLKEVYSIRYLNRMHEGKKSPEIEKIREIHSQAPTKDRFINALWMDGNEWAFYKYGNVKMIRQPDVAYSPENFTNVLKLCDHSNDQEAYSYLYSDKQSIMSELCNLKNEVCEVYTLSGHEEHVKAKIKHLLDP